MTAPPRPDFIGTYPCVVCRKRVRVYGWLPEAPLCRKCELDIHKAERLAGGGDTPDSESDSE